MKRKDKNKIVHKKENTNKRTKNIKARVKKFHLGILPYILLLCIFCIGYYKNKRYKIG